MFLRMEDVAPTNNAAEQALRPAVLWRKGCFGTRSLAGKRFVERMLSVVMTVASKGATYLRSSPPPCRPRGLVIRAGFGFVRGLSALKEFVKAA